MGRGRKTQTLRVLRNPLGRRPLQGSSSAPLSPDECVVQLSDLEELFSPRGSGRLKDTVILTLLDEWKKALPEDEWPYIRDLFPGLLGARIDRIVEEEREALCLDSLIRTHLPACLMAAGMKDEALCFASYPPIERSSSLADVEALIASASWAASSRGAGSSSRAIRSATTLCKRSGLWSLAKSVRAPRSKTAWSAMYTATWAVTPLLDHERGRAKLELLTADLQRSTSSLVERLARVDSLSPSM